MRIILLYFEFLKYFLHYRELEEENASLQAEYERLKAKQTPGSTPEEQHGVNENRNAPVDQVSCFLFVYQYR